MKDIILKQGEIHFRIRMNISAMEIIGNMLTEEAIMSKEEEGMEFCGLKSHEVSIIG